jgi:hypothetical protein
MIRSMTVEHDNALPEPAPPLWWPGAAMSTLAGYTVIGHDLECLFCVDRHGQVWLVDPEGQLPLRFVNSSIGQFTRAWSMFRPAWQALAAEGEQGLTTDERAPEIVDELTAAIEQLDSAACNSADNFWPLVLEQVRDGLL